jgi:hypothetical protein
VFFSSFSVLLIAVILQYTNIINMLMLRPPEMLNIRWSVLYSKLEIDAPVRFVPVFGAKKKSGVERCISRVYLGEIYEDGYFI